MRNTTLKPSLWQFKFRSGGVWAGCLMALAVSALNPESLRAQATVATIGGGSVSAPFSGFVNGTTLSQAKFSMPAGMALDSSGNLYIADYTNNAIRIVSQAGNAASATTTWVTNGVSRPVAVVLDGSGDVYVLNHGTGANGAVLHFTGAGGTAAAQANLASGLNNATAMAIDGQNNLYVTVNGDQVIRVSQTGTTTNIGTVTRSGTSLQGIVMLDTGILALTDAGNNGIVFMNPNNGSTTNFTGFHGTGDVLGASSAAAFNGLQGIAEAGGGTLVVADRGNNKVKLVDPSGNVSLLYGVSSNLWVTGSGKFPGWADGTAGAAKGNAEARLPYGVVIASSGNVFVDEGYYDVLRLVTGTGLSAPPAPGSPGSSSSGGSSPGSSQSFGRVAGITYDAVDNYLFVADNTNNTVQLIDLNAATNATSIFVNSSDEITNPVAVLMDADDNLYVLNQGTAPTNGFILEFDIYGNNYGQIVTDLRRPTAFTMDALGNLFVTEQSSNVFAFGAGVSNVIVTITNANTSLQGIALFDDGTLAVSDSGNEVVWAINPITRLYSKLTGKLGVAGAAVGVTNFAEFSQPRQMVRASGNQIITADSANNRLVLIARSGTTSTNHFNSLTNANLWFGNNSIDPVVSTNSKFVPIVAPFSVAVDANGDVFDSETFYADIRRMPATGISSPSSNPGVPLPVYSSPAGMSLNNEDTILYVADPVNGTVSALNLANNQTTTFLNSSSGIYEPVDVAVDVNDNVYVLNEGTGGNGSIMEFDEYGNFLGTDVASLPMPTAMKLNLGGSFLVCELNGLVQQFTFGGGSNTVANITANANVRLEGISQLDTGTVVVSDAGNDVIWGIAPGSTNAVVFTGVLGTPGTTFGAVGFAKLNAPQHLTQATISSGGGALVIADSGNNRIVLASDSGAITSSLNSSNADLWFGLPTDPLTSSSPNFVPMITPVGLALSSSGTLFDSETVYKVIRGILNTGLKPPVKPGPPPAPEIGWFDYEGSGLNGFYTVLHPVTLATFNNDVLLAINPLTNGASTYYVDGPAPLNEVPSPTNGFTPPFYQDGLAYAQPLPSLGVPDLIIDAVNIDSVGQESPVTQAEFIFQVANPTITGFNGAAFTVSEITTNSFLWYTIDGSDPTNQPPSIGPIGLDSTNAAVLSLVINSNVLFKVRAFRNGYFPSGIAVQDFSPSNFVANTISFGFSGGEASSSFVGAPGQTFYAPVTLTELPSAVMYSLQFNIVATNAGPNPGPTIVNGNFGFQSMLVQPDPEHLGQYLTIPPFMFVAPGPDPQPDSSSIQFNGNWFQNLETVNSSENLLTVGWLERAGETNLYNTLNQDLIAYSLAHDDLFPNPNEPNNVILGGYSFVIPSSATNGQTYQIQIGRPSATSDGIGAPGSSVFIADPTNGSLAAGAPVNGLKNVTVGQLKYIAGSVYPFSWFNAGDFGSSNIVNADVEQVFEAAIYNLDMPPPGSDFFDAMDSCGGTYVDLGHGYLEFNSYISGPAATNPLFSGDDTSINQIAFGDGVLDVCDVYVTFRRSLDPGLVWFQRYWNNGERVAQIVQNVPNVGAHIVSKAQPKVQATSTVSPQVDFTATDTQGSAGQTVQVPINTAIFGNYPLRLLMLNLTVEPLDSSPEVTTPVQFKQAASILGTPTMTDSDSDENYAAVWLNSTNSGVTGTATIGSLLVTIPAGAGANAAYAIHFDHASASPNGVASFPKETLTGLITLSSRTNSYYSDGIPDSWRLRWFGTIYNVLSESNACPSGDGVPNWKKFVAGVDPNVAGDFPSTGAKAPVTQGATAGITWPSTYATQYVIMRSPTLFGSPWTILSTNSGTGGTMEYDDTNNATAGFYRVEILP